MDDIFDLREFIIAILRKWRLIVVFVLLFGILGAGYKLVPELLPSAESPESQEKFIALQAQYEQDLEFITAGITSAQKELDNNQQYLETSLLLKLDEYNSYQGTAGYYVVSNEPVLPGAEDQNLLKSTQMKAVYIHLLSNVELYDDLSSVYGSAADTKLMRELVSVSNLDGNLFQVTVFGETEEKCNQMQSIIEQYLGQQSFAVSKAIGVHSLEQISKTVELKVNPNVQAARANTLNKANTLNATLIDQNKKLTELIAPAAPDRVSKKSILKFGLLGAVGGGGLAVLWIFFIDVMDVRIKTEQEICKKYKIKCLANFSNREGDSSSV